MGMFADAHGAHWHRTACLPKQGGVYSTTNAARPWRPVRHIDFCCCLQGCVCWSLAFGSKAALGKLLRKFCRAVALLLSWSSVCIVLYGLGLVSAGLAVLVWFCLVFWWSVVAALRLCNSVWFWVGFSWSRCVCLVVYFGLVSAGLAAFVWSYVDDLIIYLVV